MIYDLYLICLPKTCNQNIINYIVKAKYYIYIKSENNFRVQISIFSGEFRK